MVVLKDSIMKRIEFPFTEEAIRELHCGDTVLISGKLVTGRDAVHKRLHEGGVPPISLENHIIYHCGPVMLQDPKTKEYRCVAAGPTTSIREEPYQWQVFRDHKVRGVIGKGGMAEKTLNACKEYGACYFHAIGGAAQVLAERITSVDNVHWLELGSPEAIWELTVVDFPVVVTMDSHGVSLHDKVKENSDQILKGLL